MFNRHVATHGLGPLAGQAPKPTAAARRRQRNQIALTVFVFGLVAIYLFVTAATRSSPQAQGGTRVELLALLSFNCTRQFAYVTCSGAVQNIAGQSLSNVEAVIEWQDQSGTTQRSDEALIQYNPILAGQTSPWSVIGAYNPALQRHTVVFKYLLGGTIATRDDRPQ